MAITIEIYQREAEGKSGLMANYSSPRYRESEKKGIDYRGLDAAKIAISLGIEMRRLSEDKFIITTIGMPSLSGTSDLSSLAVEMPVAFEVLEDIATHLQKEMLVEHGLPEEEVPF